MMQSLSESISPSERFILFIFLLETKSKQAKKIPIANHRDVTAGPCCRKGEAPEMQLCDHVRRVRPL